MAKLMFSNCYFKLGSTDLSNHVKTVTLDVQYNKVDVTAMSATPWAENIAGIGSYTLQVELYQDFSGSVSDALYTAWSNTGSNTTSTFEVRPVNTTVSATNPKWTGTVFLFDLPDIDAQVGSAAMVKVTFEGQDQPTRGTS